MAVHVSCFASSPPTRVLVISGWPRDRKLLSGRHIPRTRPRPFGATTGLKNMTRVTRSIAPVARRGYATVSESDNPFSEKDRTRRTTRDRPERPQTDSRRTGLEPHRNPVHTVTHASSDRETTWVAFRSVAEQPIDGLVSRHMKGPTQFRRDCRRIVADEEEGVYAVGRRLAPGPTACALPHGGSRKSRATAPPFHTPTSDRQGSCSGRGGLASQRQARLIGERPFGNGNHVTAASRQSQSLRSQGSDLSKAAL